MRNLPLTFDCVYYSQKWWEDFAKFCGLVRIYELYQHAKNLVNSQCTLKSFETSKLHNKIDGTTIHYTAKLPLGPFRSRFAKVWRSVLCQNTKVHLIYGSFLWDYYLNAQQRWCRLQNWKACQKVDYFTRLFLSIMTQCAINKKGEFLIGNRMEN